MEENNLKISLALCIRLEFNILIYKSKIPNFCEERTCNTFCMIALRKVVFRISDQVIRIIMLTRPCIVDPLTPHFYIVKLGFTDGIHKSIHNFLNFALKHRLWVLIRTACVLMIYVLSKNFKNYHFYNRVKIAVY